MAGGGGASPRGKGASIQLRKHRGGETAVDPIDRSIDMGNTQPRRHRSSIEREESALVVVGRRACGVVRPPPHRRSLVSRRCSERGGEQRGAGLAGCVHFIYAPQPRLGIHLHRRLLVGRRGIITDQLSTNPTNAHTQQARASVILSYDEEHSSASTRSQAKPSHSKPCRARASGSRTLTTSRRAPSGSRLVLVVVVQSVDRAVV